MSLILLGLLLFFELSLLETLADGAAHGVEDHSDRLGRIVICRDNVINVGWITTSIYHCKYGNIQSLGLLHGVGLLLHVHDEQSGRQTGQIGDRTEVLLEFRTLTRLEKLSNVPALVILSMVDIFLTALRMVGKFVSIPPAQRSVT